MGPMGAPWAPWGPYGAPGAPMGYSCGVATTWQITLVMGGAADLWCEPLLRDAGTRGAI